ncbi:MAG TPA: DNA polymerase Y family protein [Burkholderiaceae bacterium]|nr:DNA polymerase Y family protein [Burkholderiaceae bacterium]HMX10559.1 DNA polymerase Y family protein [Burkholderiaceae bacterium]HMY98749.1 DNA polymerase Y family protein [Burkholderiaceae bacterium]HNB45126.1 DNA polymerase Y family protein [Burkholderiaceae bacterium]HNG79378.1 DNA polymerase Y family protein [Burkholderiaceae bacterium]
MFWAALRLPPAPEAPLPSAEALGAVATWALQFTPRVALCEEAVLLEAQASLRLFGGRRALRDRLLAEGRDLGMISLAWSRTGLAALALARAGIENGLRGPLEELLDGLPMGVLSAVLPHEGTLARLGCRRLGDVRRLPRGGISRRFGKALLDALDCAYGLLPEAYAWVELPETFSARLELPSRVELAPALLFGARRLLLSLCGWLAARHSGVLAFSLRWAHDAMRARDAGAGGELTLRTAEATRDVEHLCRLLGEHLAQVRLLAPVGELALVALEVRPLDELSASLLPDEAAPRESMPQVIERIAARLGPERVLRPSPVDDHRLEWMQIWQPHSPAQRPASVKRAIEVTEATDLPQPTWLLPQPLKLATQGPRPMYQGALQLLTGPHRVEGGWWHRLGEGADSRTGQVQRDYWVALSEHAGVLWIFQERLANDQTAWYLHGVFA